MTELTAWSDSTWHPHLESGSTSVNTFKSTFLKVGSGDETVLDEEHSRLTRLEVLEDNWEGRGWPRPSRIAVLTARRVLPGLRQAAVNTGWPWSSPHITADDSGEVLFEWWCGPRKLTLYFNAIGAIEFIKVWGARVDSDMDSGTMSSTDAFRALWRWLVA